MVQCRIFAVAILQVEYVYIQYSSRVRLGAGQLDLYGSGRKGPTKLQLQLPQGLPTPQGCARSSQPLLEYFGHSPFPASDTFAKV